MSLQEKIEKALDEGKRISLQSFLLRERGERKLECIIETIFKRFDREAFVGPVHAAVRELIQNASKANLKRVLFLQKGLDPNMDEEYHQGMSDFRGYLVESKLNRYRPLIVKENLFFTVDFEFGEKALAIYVRNPFPLYPAEEKRIRQKFHQSRTFDNLYEFYMEYSDLTEGAGMGIAMVEILLNQSGINRRNFTIFTEPVTNRTAGRIVMPICDSYVTVREQFNNELKLRGCTPEELRALVRDGTVKLHLL